MPMLPHEYQITGTGEKFLLFDSGVGDINTMFIFTTNDGIDMVANSGQWFGDCAFKSCPQIYANNSWSIMKFFPVCLHFYRLKLKLYISNFSQRYATL